MHLPQFNNSCADQTGSCILKSVTVSECVYDSDTFDSGTAIVAATEIRVKLMSRQATQKAAGSKNLDFHQTDEVGNRCAEINDAAIQWAYKTASPEARKRYDTVGQKLVTGDDLGPYNAGPLWIWTYMNYVEDSAKTTMTVKAPMMRTPTDYIISGAAGFHYCKVLSPFRAMEWIYIDSLKAHYSIKNAAKTEAFLQ